MGVREWQQSNIIRWSGQAKPSLGGISFYIIFLFSISAFSLLPLSDNLTSNINLIGLIVASTVGFFIGLADDAYNTNPFLKFVGQFLCANILIATGVVIEISPYSYFNMAFTTFWVIGIMNSINMLDNMDGITANIAISILISILMCIFIDHGLNNAYSLIIIGVMGALIGFLYFNWYPSKMFMGDTGSQFLGVFLAGASILFLWNYRDPNGWAIQPKQFLLPCIAFIVPLIDTLTVTIARIRRGQSPFVGGKDHTTHHLAYLGLRDDKVVIILSSLSFLSVGLIYSILKIFDVWNIWYSLIIIIYLLAAFIIIQILYHRGKYKMMAND